MKTKNNLALRTPHLVLLLALGLQILSFPPGTCLAQTTAFSYQGRLNDGATAANGSYDLQFTIYDALTGGTVQGGPLTNAPTSVSNGLFTVTLDFGAGPFTGADRWMEISVRTNGGSAFVTLSPRQDLTPTPYAIYSSGAGNAVSAGSLSGHLPASQLTGTIAPAQIPAAVVTNGASGVTLAGSFSGNGAGVTNVNFETLTWPPDFVVVSSPVVGNSPSSVVAADVNGDGKVDLICANSGDNTLSVLFNDGAGGFGQSYSLGVGNGPVSVTAADVNGDGYVDLICANKNDNTLSVLTNDGGGGFVLASSPAVGGAPVSVVAADVNGDGKVDLICANQNDNTLSVLTNDGSGGFVLASSPGVGRVPFAVTAVDVNGDGKVDLITANRNGGTLSVLTNDGSGGFVLASSLFGGSLPTSVLAADVNGDGKVDLICGSGNGHGSQLTILTNDGSGGFALASRPLAGRQPGPVVAADLNGDGKLDLICVDQGQWTLSVLTNDGSGNFVLVSSPPVGRGPVSLVAADVNGDGKLELITANQNDNTLSVLVSAIPNVNSATVNATTVSASTVAWSSAGLLANDQGGSLELGNSLQTGATPFIDFHYGSGINQDYNVRLINDASNQLSLYGDLQVNGAVTAPNINASGSVNWGTGAYLTNDQGGSIELGNSLEFGAVPFIDFHYGTGINQDYNVRLINDASNHLSLYGDLQANGAVTATSFTGDGSGLTNLYTTNLTGTLAPAQIPNLDASAITSGTLADARLAGTYSSALTLSNAANAFAGNGAGLSSLNASQLSTGTVADARLSTNIAILNANQTFVGAITLSNSANSFTGNGSGLTSLNASKLTSGTLADARLSTNAALLNANQTFTGQDTFINSIPGAGLTLDTSSASGGFLIQSAGSMSSVLGLAQGTGDFSYDAHAGDTVLRTDSGFLLLQRGGAESAIAITAHNRVGIGTITPTTTLEVNGTVTAASFIGDAGGLTNLNASALGTNIPYLNANQTFIGQNTFSNSVVGGGVTLDAGGAAGAFNLKYTNGIRSSLGLATVAGNYSTDAGAGDTVLRVSGGKLLLQSGSGASAIAITTNNWVGIGTNAPATALHVATTNDTEISLQSMDSGGRRWPLQSSGAGTPGLTASFQIIDRSPEGGSRLLIDTNGNVGIGTSGPTNKLHVNGGVSATAFVTTSDRNAKENFAPVSPQEVLNKVVALPVTTWNFKTMNDGRHMGPMAQDFYAAFGLGGGNTTITSIDPDGVAMAAIQGLNQKLEAENAELKVRLERLEKALNAKLDADAK